jgi:peptide/nickel transport system ATP-binding protein
VTVPLLDVEGLTVRFPGSASAAVQDFSLQMGREKIGIIGESGSGKSLTARALFGLVPAPGQVTARRLSLGGLDLTRIDAKGWQRLRGRKAGMILQDAKFSLNPVMSIGAQIAETLVLHERLSAGARRARVHAMLRDVGITDPERVACAYPHQLSGGMGQRAMIAMMLVSAPDLLVADEPTSALDVLLREQVLQLLDRLCRERGLGLLLISHDLRLVARVCDRLLVMYRGRIVERLAARDLAAAQHPYTQALLRCLPSPATRGQLLPTLDRTASWAQQ